ncbi:heat stress transcription factor A-7a-like isoform X2 [Andrographis paniculata]|uniref:heat stress transcription factor A-7a-like isoform X2 n=1 Tax=Andrographis paniculata TaxID=175694 RepID=UPI0021E7327E|nr:heat stress transcription factor A-7a-like isoform X2 [Andrographis paniculata]
MNPKEECYPGGSSSLSSSSSSSSRLRNEGSHYHHRQLLLLPSAAAGSSSSSLSAAAGDDDLHNSNDVGAVRPIEGLHEVGPPPFLTKTFEMVDDIATDQIVSWSRGGRTFVVWDPNAFSNAILPSYFKHNNFSSFIRQLNTYKMDADKWEFGNEAFLRGRRDLLQIIRRRRTSPTQQQGAANNSDDHDTAEVERLRREKKALLAELLQLRQQHQTTREYARQMEARLRGTERKQQQMMRFLATAMQNPDVVRRLQIRPDTKKKQRIGLDAAAGEYSRRPPVKLEEMEFWDGCYGLDQGQVSELEVLALEMQGRRRPPPKEEEGEMDGDDQELHLRFNCDREVLDDGFWEELLSSDKQGLEQDEEEGDGQTKVNMEELTERLDFLCSGSTPKTKQ